MRRIASIAFWLAELWVPALVAAALVAALCGFASWWHGRWLPGSDVALAFLATWLFFVLLSARGIVAKLALWREMRGLPGDRRTVEEARSRWRASGRGVFG